MTVSDAADQRLDVYIAEQRGITRHAAQVLIRAGYVTLNERPGRAGQRVRIHDLVHVREPDDQQEAGMARDGASRRVATGDRGFPSAPVSSRAEHDGGNQSALNVIYEDDALAVIDKPAGIVVHPAPGHHGGTLADMLRQRGTTWSLLGGEERPGIVHRLDRDTSGLLVVAKTEAAHRALAAQLKERTLGRTYIAVVNGGFREDSGTIDAPIGRAPHDRKRMAVVDGGRQAITDFRVSERLGPVSVLEVSLRTGRTHQIRVHLAYIRHPVLGDTVYGRADPRIARPALHATRLTLVHPVDGDARIFESSLPDEMQALLGRLRAEHA